MPRFRPSKTDLCPESKRTVLSMRHSYLATKPSRGAWYYAGSLNDSGVTVNECARDSGLKSGSWNNTGSMRFVSAIHDYGQRSLFLAPVSSANTTEKRPLLAANMTTSVGTVKPLALEFSIRECHDLMHENCYCYNNARHKQLKQCRVKCLQNS